MMRYLTIVLMTLAAQAFASDEAYLCIADKATGFSYNSASKTWEQARFNVSQSKFSLSKKTNGRWEWKELGERIGRECPRGFNEFGLFRCEGLEDVWLNRTTLRFQLVYPIGFLDGRDSNDNNPFIVIGRCTAH